MITMQKDMLTIYILSIKGRMLMCLLTDWLAETNMFQQ